MAITEAFGEFRTGKTQLSHTLCGETVALQLLNKNRCRFGLPISGFSGFRSQRCIQKQAWGGAHAYRWNFERGPAPPPLPPLPLHACSLAKTCIYGDFLCMCSSVVIAFCGTFQ